MVDIRILKTIVFVLAVVIALAMAFALPAAATLARGETVCHRQAYTDPTNIWYSMTEEGNGWALHALSHLYEKPWDVESDAAKARYWHPAASERGNSDLKFKLSLLHVKAQERALIALTHKPNSQHIGYAEPASRAFKDHFHRNGVSPS